MTADLMPPSDEGGGLPSGSSEGEKTWKFCYDQDDETRVLLSLDEYIENEIETANELAGQVICKGAILLIDGDCIDEPEKAKSEKRFLIYQDNREDVLKQFCKNPMEWRK